MYRVAFGSSFTLQMSGQKNKIFQSREPSCKILLHLKRNYPFLHLMINLKVVATVTRHSLVFKGNEMRRERMARNHSSLLFQCLLFGWGFFSWSSPLGCSLKCVHLWPRPTVMSSGPGVHLCITALQGEKTKCSMFCFYVCTVPLRLVRIRSRFVVTSRKFTLVLINNKHSTRKEKKKYCKSPGS